MEKRGLLIALFQEMKSTNDPEKLTSGIEILYKLCYKIYNNPGEKKFLFIKNSNKIISERLLPLNNINETLLEIGFEKENEGYRFNDGKIDELKEVLGLIKIIFKEENYTFDFKKQISKGEDISNLVKEKRKEIIRMERENEEVKKELMEKIELDKIRRKNDARRTERFDRQQYNENYPFIIGRQNRIHLTKELKNIFMIMGIAGSIYFIITGYEAWKFGHPIFTYGRQRTLFASIICFLFYIFLTEHVVYDIRNLLYNIVSIFIRI